MDKTMVKGKRVQNTFISPFHKDNHIWDEESQIIFVLVTQKFTCSDFVERFGLSS